MKRKPIWIISIIILILVTVRLLIHVKSGIKPVVYVGKEQQKSAKALHTPVQENKGVTSQKIPDIKKDTIQDPAAITEKKAELVNSIKTGHGVDNKVTKKTIRKFSSLTVTSAVYKNGNIEITGESDLPDNSILLITVTPEGNFESIGSIGSDDIKVNQGDPDDKDKKDTLFSRASVKNGKYLSVIKVPTDKPRLYHGPYKIEVKFFLDMQTALNVLHLIGDGAKNLTGKLVVLVPISQYKSLQYSVAKSIKALELKAYSITRANKSLPGEFNYVLAHFFLEWELNNLKGMLKYSYKPWVKSEKNNEALFKSWFGSKKLVGAKILNYPKTNPLMGEVNVEIHYIDNKDENQQVISKKVTVKVIKDDSYNWGVFPLSIIKKNAILKMDYKKDK